MTTEDSGSQEPQRSGDLRKLFAHLDFHCNPANDPCARKGDRPYDRCDNCRIYVFADRFMGLHFQEDVLGGPMKNPHILVLDAVGCQMRCWFCYARDIRDAVNLASPGGWKGYRTMSPEDISKCAECKLTERYKKIESKRPFARFRITGGEPLFSTAPSQNTPGTLRGSEGSHVLQDTVDFWLATFTALSDMFGSLKEQKRIQILTHEEFVKSGRAIDEEAPTWLTGAQGKVEIRFDTNGWLLSSSEEYAASFVDKILELHKRDKMDSIRVNIDYSLKGPTPLEFEWSQSRELPVDPVRITQSFDLEQHPQYKGIKYLSEYLKRAYVGDPSFEQSLRLDIERGINHTDTTKYGTRKLGVLYDESALNWELFEKKAGIEFSEVNNPLQLLGQAPYSKYIKDHLKMGAEVLIVDNDTKQTLLRFDPFPDGAEQAGEYDRKIAEPLEKANKMISAGVKKADKTGRFGVQVVIRPVRPSRPHPEAEKASLRSYTQPGA